MDKLPILSASKLADLDKCSWIAYSKTILKVPDEANSGSKRGNCVHALLECLLDKRHYALYKEIVKNKTIKKSPSAVRFILKQMKKEKLEEVDNKGTNNFDLINEMLLVALKTDFFLKGTKLEKPELKFEYTNPEKTYCIKGFIDKLGDAGEYYIIADYKSSDKDEDYNNLDGNVQALMYSLYCKLEKQKPAKVRFLMLRHPKNVIREIEFDEKTLKGFEDYLTYISSWLQNFTYKKAISNLAVNQGYASKGFKGKIVCGKASFKGELKKDGTEMYYCKYKFPMTYYGIYNENGDLIKTSLKKEDLKPKENEFVQAIEYPGCPHFNKKEVNEI